MTTRPRILLTHTPDMRRNYYGQRALAGLQARGDVVLHEGADALGGLRKIRLEGARVGRQRAQTLAEQADQLAISGLPLRDAGAHGGKVLPAGLDARGTQARHLGRTVAHATGRTGRPRRPCPRGRRPGSRTP